MILISYFFDLLITNNVCIPSFLFLYDLDKNKSYVIGLFLMLYYFIFKKVIYLSFVVILLYLLGKILAGSFYRFKNIVVLFVYISFLIIFKNYQFSVLPVAVYFLYGMVLKTLNR